MCPRSGFLYRRSVFVETTLVRTSEKGPIPQRFWRAPKQRESDHCLQIQEIRTMLWLKSPLCNDPVCRSRLCGQSKAWWAFGIRSTLPRRIGRQWPSMWEGLSLMESRVGRQRKTSRIYGEIIQGGDGHVGLKKTVGLHHHCGRCCGSKWNDGCKPQQSQLWLGGQKTNKHKQLSGSVPRTGGGNIFFFLCWQCVFLGKKRNTYANYQESQENARTFSGQTLFWRFSCLLVSLAEDVMCPTHYILARPSHVWGSAQGCRFSKEFLWEPRSWYVSLHLPDHPFRQVAFCCGADMSRFWRRERNVARSWVKTYLLYMWFSTNSWSRTEHSSDESLFFETFGSSQPSEFCGSISTQRHDPEIQEGSTQRPPEKLRAKSGLTSTSQKRGRFTCRLRTGL